MSRSKLLIFAMIGMNLTYTCNGVATLAMNRTKEKGVTHKHCSTLVKWFLSGKLTILKAESLCLHVEQVIKRWVLTNPMGGHRRARRKQV